MASERSAGDYRDIIHKLHRNNVANGLRLHRILDHFALPPVSEENIDEALDQERGLRTWPPSAG